MQHRPIPKIKNKHIKLPTIALHLKAAEVAAIRPALQLAMDRIDEARLNPFAAGDARNDGAYGGRKFSDEMYSRLISAHKKLNKKSQPARIAVDAFEIALFAVAHRITRRQMLPRGRASAPDLEDNLELARKAAMRRAIAAVGEGLYSKAKEKWEGFRQWLKCYVFNEEVGSRRHRSSKTVQAKKAAAKPRKRTVVVVLEEVAGEVMDPESKLAGDPASLGHELRSLAAEIRRGRWGVETDDLLRDPQLGRDIAIEYLRRRGHDRDLKGEFQSLAVRQSALAAKMRRVMVVEDDTPAEAAQEKQPVQQPRADSAAAAPKPFTGQPEDAVQAGLTEQPNVTVTAVTITESSQAPVSNGTPPDALVQSRARQFVEWVVDEILQRDWLAVCNDMLRRLHSREDLPNRERRPRFDDCRPAFCHTTIRELYTDWGLRWLLGTATATIREAEAIIRTGYPLVHERWQRMDPAERERRITAIHLRYEDAFARS